MGGTEVTLYAYVPDLMDRSKVSAAAPSVVMVADVSKLSPAGGDTVVLDLSRPQAFDAVARLCGSGARVVGFTSHVDRERVAQARAAGCEVLARSAFFSRLPAVLTSSAPGAG
jgi:hypothetical protein